MCCSLSALSVSWKEPPFATVDEDGIMTLPAMPAAVFLAQLQRFYVRELFKLLTDLAVEGAYYTSHRCPNQHAIDSSVLRWTEQ